MENIIFNTIKDAENSGYIRHSRIPRCIEIERFVCLVKNDTSGVNSYGYSFDVVLKDGIDTVKTVAKSITVRFEKEKNKINGYPSYSVMFLKSDFGEYENLLP